MPAEERGMCAWKWCVWKTSRRQIAAVELLGGLCGQSVCGILFVSILLVPHMLFAMSLEREFIEDIVIQSVSKKSQSVKAVHFMKAPSAHDQTLFDVYLDEERPFVGGEVLEGLEESAGLALLDSSGTLTIETVCDRRGVRAYSLALGHRRARQIQEFLQNLGIAQSKIHSTSYGNDHLACQESSSRCWEENVRMQSTFRYMAIKKPKLGCLGRLRFQGIDLQLLGKPTRPFLQKIRLAPTKPKKTTLHSSSDF